MRDLAESQGRFFADLALNSVKIATDLDQKEVFLEKCLNFGLRVPDFFHFQPGSETLIEELRSLRASGLFENRHYFLKPLQLARNERLGNLASFSSEENLLSLLLYIFSAKACA